MKLGERQARGLLGHAQHLTHETRSDGSGVAGVAAAVVGLQAQDLGAASLGVRARLANSSASAVEDARIRARTVVRTWCMRGTLHLMAAQDARWLVDLLGPVGLARGRKRRAQMGVDAPEAVKAVVQALAEHGALTRHEVAARVRQEGSSWPTIHRCRSTSWPPPHFGDMCARPACARGNRRTP